MVAVAPGPATGGVRAVAGGRAASEDGGDRRSGLPGTSFPPYPEGPAERRLPALGG